MNRNSLIRSASAVILVVLALGIASNASAATGYAFIDSIAEFFGLETAESTARSAEMADPNAAAPMAMFTACTYSSTGSTAWNTASTWSVSAGCPSGTIPGTTVGNSDTVVIQTGDTVTLNTSPSQILAALTIGGTTSNSASALTMNTNTTLNVAGAVQVGDSASNQRKGTLTFASGSILTAGSLTVGGIAAQGSTVVMTSGGTLTVSGASTITSGSTITAGTGAINVGGNWTNNGTFTANTSTVI